MSCAAGAWDHYLQNRDRLYESVRRRREHVRGMGQVEVGPDQIDALLDDIGELKLVVASLLNLLVARGVLSVEEFAQQAKIIDELDGRSDGRFHGRIKANGEITPEAQDRTELDDLADAARDE